MRIDVFTIFPDVVAGYCGASILGRAVERGVLDVRVHDLRQGSSDARRSVDDAPFGGGAGMVLMPEPLFRSVEAVPDLPRPLFLLTPGGRRFDQSVAAELAALAVGPSGGFSLLCGRYEGVDQRVADHLVDGELSVGDFVLAGGELGALVVIETVARLRPDVLGNEDSAADESFSDGLLEYPQYTRPASFRGWEVPAVLRSGDHGAVAAWRRTQALLRTAARRPDLLERLVGASALSDDDVRALAQHGYHVPSGSERIDPTEPGLT
ncbi:MAG TPA: tRNA (guanosine(37)-N1)-methyltransferase TrmD [Acidimicrobiales bacterium]